MLVGIGSAVQGLHVERVKVYGGGGIFDDLIPGAESIEAGGPIREEDRVGLAEDGFGVEVDSTVVVFAAISLVSRVLELKGVSLALLVREGSDGVLRDLGKFVGTFYRRGFLFGV